MSFRRRSEGAMARQARFIAFTRRWVETVDGTAVWPHSQDFCPDTLFAGSVFNKPRKGEWQTRS